MTDPAPRQRDSARTRDAILTAARDVLAKQGFSGWGVNAIARAAGCDKQLIYRYFGGLDGLATAIGEDMAAWLDSALSADPSAKPPATYADLTTRLLLTLARALRGHRLAQRIIAWELAEDSPLVRSFAAARGTAMMAWIARERGSLVPPAGVDAPAINAILVAAVQQLVLASAASGRFSGVPLESDADWARIEQAVRALTAAAYPA